MTSDCHTPIQAPSSHLRHRGVCFAPMSNAHLPCSSPCLCCGHLNRPSCALQSRSRTQFWIPSPEIPPCLWLLMAGDHGPLQELKFLHPSYNLQGFGDFLQVDLKGFTRKKIATCKHVRESSPQVTLAISWQRRETLRQNPEGDA